MSTKIGFRPMSDLELAVLKTIVDDASRARWIIIINLALKYIKELRAEGKKPHEIAVENCKQMEELRLIFIKLVREGKIELDEKTGKVKLTDAGEKFLEEQTKTDPV